MSRFYIKTIGVSGDNVDYSQVTFDAGVNILHGPSNSGKSYVINCINFMFGATEIPFTRASTGYDTIHMRLESADGEFVQMKRQIVDGKTGDAGANLVTVQTNFQNIQSDDYGISNSELSYMLLKLIGIEEKHSIISTQAFKTQNLVTGHSFTLILLMRIISIRKPPHLMSRDIRKSQLV